MTLWRVCLMLVALAAAACAQFAVSPRLDEARQLIAVDRVEEALANVEALLRDDPHNPELRAFLARERELAVARWFAQAEFARSSGNQTEAERFLDRILALEPRN